MADVKSLEIDMESEKKEGGALQVSSKVTMLGLSLPCLVGGCWSSVITLSHPWTSSFSCRSSLGRFGHGRLLRNFNTGCFC